MQLLARYGASMSEYDYYALGGLTFINLYREYQRRFSLPVSAEQLLAERQEIYLREYVPKFRLFPHAEEFLQLLRARGFKIGIASASSPDIFGVFFESNPELKKYFDCVVTCDELGVCKPTTVVYEECIRRLGKTKESAIIFEDSYVGLVGAKQTGCPVVCILSADDRVQEKRLLADLTATDYSELLEFAGQTGTEEADVHQVKSV